MGRGLISGAGEGERDVDRSLTGRPVSGTDHVEDLTSETLAQHEREIAMVKADPERFDCGFFILQKS